MHIPTYLRARNVLKPLLSTPYFLAAIDLNMQEDKIVMVELGESQFFIRLVESFQEKAWTK